MFEISFTIILAVAVVVINFVVVLFAINKRNKETIKRIRGLEVTQNSIIEVLQRIEYELKETNLV